MISNQIFSTCPEIKIGDEYDDDYENYYNFNLTIRDFQREHPDEAFTIKDFMDYIINRLETSSWGSRRTFLIEYEALTIYLNNMVRLRNAERRMYQSLFYYKIVSVPSSRHLEPRV